MARLSREIIVTEKIDGTNASVHVTEDGDVIAASRNRWLTIGSDNYGFAAWVLAHKKDLLTLGAGTHFGEWWGRGIQRGYGLTEKRFSIFDVARGETKPACCHIVPILYRGEFCSLEIDFVLIDLAERGSRAAPGFMRPEGIVVFHTAANVGFKKTLESDEAKGGMP
jgi:hypothetical protein